MALDAGGIHAVPFDFSNEVNCALNAELYMMNQARLVIWSAGSWYFQQNSNQVTSGGIGADATANLILDQG